MRKYIPFFKAGMMAEMSYRAAIFSWMGICVLQLACIIFLWVAVFANATTDVINGFTYKQMIVYFVFANIYAFITLNSDTLSTIDDEIKDGTIAISFIKPISYRLRFLFQAFGGVATRVMIMGIPAFAIAFAIFIMNGYVKIKSIPEFILYLVMFVVCQITAIALFDTVNYICGVLCFYTTAAWGLNQAKEVVVNFLSGVFIPIAFFPGIFGSVCQQLPFAGLTQNPVLIITQSVTIEESLIFIVKNIAWFIIFEALAKLLFNHASKKVTIQGG